ncbi:hypothetical protein P4O66_007385 [Electrophorus voltai]|uniref:Uncharacterized protein n=1 Tax=Electrophorus voltai TaxID=2609070 RepID=A0AAD8ZIM6_9TELE|nr:hypothetical protein P4O66_007385 [Electrophorus voltai]
MSLPEFEPILDTSFWSLPREWSFTDPTLVYSSTRSAECYDEQQGDKCMTLLLGTWKDNGTPCIVTKSCRDTMTRFGCPHYSLSHQLLYFMIGKMKTVSRIFFVMCYPIVYSVYNYVDSQKKKSSPSLQFFYVVWLVSLTFINQTGYSIFWHGKTKIWVALGKMCHVSGFLTEDYSEMFEEFLDTPHKRVKRREKTLKDGCSSHMTGVAMSALGGYLNFYLAEQDITKRPLI